VDRSVPAPARAAARLIAGTRGLFDVLSEAAFPIGCAACPEALASRAERGDLPLCAACERGLVACGEPFCLTCAQRGGAPRRCNEPAHLRLAAAFLFAEPARALVHAFKFGDAPDLARPLVRHAWATAAFARARRPEMVVPVPLHAVRRRERGYDQAALLAREFGACAGAPDVAVLARRVPTRQQARLSARERAGNVANAFVALRPELVRGRRVALVDDVVTTGATVDACVRVLRGAGAAAIEAWAVAYEPLE
jgi:ComF family protein